MMRSVLGMQRFRTWRVWRWPAVLAAGLRTAGEPALLHAGPPIPLRPSAQAEVPDLDDTAFPGSETARVKKGPTAAT